MALSIGIDVGSGVIKTSLFRVEGGNPEWLARWDARIRQRVAFRLVEDSLEYVLGKAGMKREEIDYVATTGEGESFEGATGHFYTMTTHARGALYLNPEARAVLDIGALNGRAIRIDGRGKVLNYRMTSQCASGSGQFLENISRYLGIAQDEIGALSRKSTNPEKVSSICAVLAETDVINMVSRGIPTAEILKGIHHSIAGRLVRLVRSVGAEDVVLVTGGLAQDTGLIERISALINEVDDGMPAAPLRVTTHPEAGLAGAYGAALLGAYRHRQLSRSGRLAVREAAA
jgi:benzoyl-CoA reductase subunit D